MNCHEMKLGETYGCGKCGLEFKVTKECKEVNQPAENCGCHEDGPTCTFSCCGADLQKIN